MIPVDFIIRANTAAFTKAMAGAENTIRGLKKSLASLGGGSFGTAIGILGIVRGFSSAITSAQQLRDELEKMGKPISDSVRSVAEYGDQIDNIKKSVTGLSVATLGFFTRAGEGLGLIVNRLRGMSLQQQALYDQINRDTEKAIKARDEAEQKFRKENSPEKLKAAQERLNQARIDGAKRAAETEERIRLIIEQKKNLESEINTIVDGRVDKIEKQIEVARLEADLVLEKKKLEEEISAEKDKQAKIHKEINTLQARKADVEGGIKDTKRDEATARADRYLPTIEDLAKRAEQNEQQRAAYGIGSSGSLVSALGEDSPEMQARKALELERQAREAALSSDLDPKTRLERAAQFQSEAEEIRGRLSGFAQSSDTDIGGEFKEALSDAEKKLEEINESLKGLIKSQ